MQINKAYNAKILLFGEHTIIKGSQALAMPLNNFYGKWEYCSNLTQKASLQQKLPLFQQYLATQGLNKYIALQIFLKELQKGLYFYSNIPTGYGLGSSGALCAAIFDQFGLRKDLPLLTLKKILAEMEGFFHGSSSGIDPLVAYLNYPIKVKPTIQAVQLPPIDNNGEYVFFLLDTTVKRDASIFINGFLERCKDDNYTKNCEATLVPFVDKTIQHFIDGKGKELFQTMHELSWFQFHFFDFMILEQYKTLWQKGLNSEHFKLKICGAGGGGFLIGLSNNYEQTADVLKSHTILPFYRF